ncbi:MAG: 50S ribosomal protein L13 [Myxococcales bacterium]|nr:50S ribosomal protein L13 [Myxococcales bacterium]
MGVQAHGATRSLKPGDVTQQWWVIDAEDVVLGRLSTRIASVLRGKHRPIYTPHADAGDFVVVVNADKVKLTGRKREQKTYYRHSGWPGGLREINADKVLTGAHPERVIERAVRGMLPHNSLGRKLFRKLKVYAGPEHPHAAQKPEVLQLG